MEQGSTILDVMGCLAETDQSFFSIVQYLDSRTRNHIVAAHLRNTSQSLAILRLMVPEEETIVMNIPLQRMMDPSGNFAQGFMNPVPIVPTEAQLMESIEENVRVSDMQCSICQENVTSATRIRHCGHCFHSECIREWFTMNTRCPMCRHDIRDLQPSPDT